MPPKAPGSSSGLFPVIHCNQEIPCDPCVSVCPKDFIFIDGQDIRKIPEFTARAACTGCQRCLVTLSWTGYYSGRFPQRFDNPIVSIPYELNRGSFLSGDEVEVVDTEGLSLGKLRVAKILTRARMIARLL